MNDICSLRKLVNSLAAGNYFSRVLLAISLDLEFDWIILLIEQLWLIHAESLWASCPRQLVLQPDSFLELNPNG